MKKSYEIPEIDLTMVQNNDILTSSNELEPDFS